MQDFLIQLEFAKNSSNPTLVAWLFQFHEEAVSCILQMIGKDP